MLYGKKKYNRKRKKRQKLVIKYLLKRSNLKNQIKQANSLQEKLELHRKLQQLPRNSSPVRLRNRCLITGRSRGYFKRFWTVTPRIKRKWPIKDFYLELLNQVGN